MHIDLSNVRAKDSDAMDITIRFEHQDMPESLAD